MYASFAMVEREMVILYSAYVLEMDVLFLAS